jgi:diguanylate cyclase (GGDEF)-like protein
MDAAGFILAINLFVAGIFATSFGVVAGLSRTAEGARWLALAYGLAILNAVLEFILPMQASPQMMDVVIFAVALSGFIVAVIGLARHYEQPVPWMVLAVFALASLTINIAISGLPYQSPTRTVLYQFPYTIVHVIGAWVVFRCKRRGALELALLSFLLLSSLQFVAKPVMAHMWSGPSARDYLHSLYGAISQMMTAFLLITNGLLMLLILVRDLMAEMTARSETDTLSGLFNRRGFEDRADRLLATALRAGMPATMVVVDLDHFKAINDSHGHDAGDRVIRAFADVLGASADAGAVTGRLGGEEFAVLIPGADLATARLYAEGVRMAFSNLAIPGLSRDQRISASFGVTQLTAGDSLSDLLRRADAALYEAKRGGRDRVCTTGPDPVPLAATLPPGERRRGSRAAE